MASIKRILRSYPWKNYKNFNWNRSFIWPTLHFAWFKLALWSRKIPNTVLNFWRFRRQSMLNASQTWLQSNEYCAHIHWKIMKINWNGLFTCLKIYFAWLKLALWSRRLLIQHWTFWPFAGSQRSMLVKHGFNQHIITLMSVEKSSIF